jgi:hypothetical protein
MKYILLIHGNDESWQSFGRETIDEIMRTHASVTKSRSHPACSLTRTN